jgi:hypothetical protein
MSVFGNGDLQRVHEREGESLRAYARREGDVSPWNSSPNAMLILAEESPGYIIFILRGCRALRGMGNCLGFRNSNLGFAISYTLLFLSVPVTSIQHRASSIVALIQC